MKNPLLQIPFMRWGDLLTLAILLYFVLILYTKKASPSNGFFQTFEVHIEDSLVLSASLNSDSLFVINGRVGEVVVKARGGTVRVTQANCRHRICMKQRVSEKGGTIVCVPNRVVIESKTEDEELDFIVQ